MRFIHSADWQIGMKAIHAGTAADVVRAARLTTAAGVCNLAAEEGVDFLLLAGDTFEDNAVDRNLVEKVAKPSRRYCTPYEQRSMQDGRLDVAVTMGVAVTGAGSIAKRCG